MREVGLDPAGGVYGDEAVVGFRPPHGDAVLRLRRAFQQTMKAELISVVERLTQRTVQAFMSANHNEPDTAAEIFILDGEPVDASATRTGAV